MCRGVVLRWVWLWLVAGVIAVFLVGCSFLRDPSGTLERVRGGQMRVGLVANEPWTRMDGEPSGVEVELVEDFAAELDAETVYVRIESVGKLIAAEHPTIGAITLFGQTFWLGWLMLPALAWSGLPAIFLGRAKLPLARELHNKVLYADAHMNKADWLTAAAAMVGVVGIGFGLWWADAVGPP